MADVRRNRAQMLLVGALALATVFILLSLLLNSVIYTENLATRQANADADYARAFQQDVRDGVGDAVEYTNRNGDESYATRTARYETVLHRWRELRGNFSAAEGRYTNVTADGGYEGTRIADDNASTTMTPRDGQANWTVAADVKARNLVFDVNGSAGLPTASASSVESDLSANSSSAFHVVFDDGTRTAIAVYNNSTTNAPQLLVYDYASGKSGTCSIPDGRIDVARRLADDQYCRPLTLVSPSGNHDVRFVGGDRATGTYALTVDRLETPLRTESDDATYGDQCTAAFASNNSSTPYTTPAIYSANVSLDFQSATTTYQSTERVAPGERGRPPSEPRFASTNVSEGDPRNFTVTWTVTDPNGDLSSVRVELVKGGATENSTSVSVGGSSAGGTLVVSESTDGPYRVVTTVTDAAGHQRSVAETHETDGNNLGCPP